MVLALFLCLVACKSPEAKAKEAEAHYNHGMELMKNSQASTNYKGEKDDQDSAIAELREAVRLKPDDPKMHDLLKLMLDEKGDKEGALAESAKSFELQGEALYAQGDYDGAMRKCHFAISFYDDAIRDYPEAKNSKQNDAVARKLVAYLVAVDRRQKEFLTVERENRTAA